MVKINLCVPTLNRYDLLKILLESAEAGTVKPDAYHIIDNGGTLNLNFPRTYIHRFGKNLGVAASWNWFLQNIEGIKIIANDDIELYTNTLVRFLNNCKPDSINSARSLGDLNVFSFYSIGDTVLKNVGLFDETIAPNYGYFEDNDYFYRAVLAGYGANLVSGCNVIHHHSSTLKKFSTREADEHHRKFKEAEKRYIQKWGGKPGSEVYKTPYNR